MTHTMLSVRLYFHRRGPLSYERVLCHFMGTKKRVTAVDPSAELAESRNSRVP